MCLTLPSLRMKRRNMDQLNDEYRRIVRLLELKRAGKKQNNYSHIACDIEGGISGENTPPRRAENGDQSFDTIRLTPTKPSGAFDLPMPLLADILTPVAERGTALGSGAAVALICSLCLNGLEVNSRSSRTSPFLMKL